RAGRPLVGKLSRRPRLAPPMARDRTGDDLGCYVDAGLTKRQGPGPERRQAPARDHASSTAKGTSSEPIAVTLPDRPHPVSLQEGHDGRTWSWF
ncbi:hypothetical protein, partial [Nonomuraea dietziae]|uniref:hypothetical protein n=1 Tax=Nonomuraea dietziae TaxID=65515 RepID=UPI0031D29EE2